MLFNHREATRFSHVDFCVGAAAGLPIVKMVDVDIGRWSPLSRLDTMRVGLYVLYVALPLGSKCDHFVVSGTSCYHEGSAL